MCRSSERQCTRLVQLRDGLTLRMYMWAKVNTVQRAVVIVSALGAQYSDNQPLGPQEGAEVLAEPIDISLALWEKSVQDPSKSHRCISLLSVPILRVDPTPLLAQFFLSS